LATAATVVHDTNTDAALKFAIDPVIIRGIGPSWSIAHILPPTRAPGRRIFAV
jgi:hypothetical protein